MRINPPERGGPGCETAKMDDPVGSTAGAPELARARSLLRSGALPSMVVLVEGVSDQTAVETLARRRRLDLAEDVVVVPMGGATTIGHFLGLFGPHGYGLELAGLCDLNQEGDFRRGLEQAGVGSGLDRYRMEALGFFVCEADLEEELIRALGAAGVEQIIEEQGELGSLNLLRRQPFHRDRPIEQVLWRFMGSRSGRKATYARLMVDALDLDRIPHPLDALIDHIASRGSDRSA